MIYLSFALQYSVPYSVSRQKVAGQNVCLFDVTIIKDTFYEEDAFKITGVRVVKEIFIKIGML